MKQMNLNEKADLIVADAKNKAQGKTQAQRWGLYEHYKKRLNVVCAWGKEYELYILELTEALRI